MLVDRDHKKASIEKIASRDDQLAMRGPAGEKGVDGREQARAFLGVELRRDTENPDS